MPEFNFNYEFVSAGAPIVTLSTLGIAFNSVCRSMLGYPEKINIGFDENRLALGIKAHDEESTVKHFEFESRVRNGWIRIGAKDFVNYLSVISKIDFIKKAKQFIATYNEDDKMLIVIIKEEYLKR